MFARIHADNIWPRVIQMVINRDGFIYLARFPRGLRKVLLLRDHGLCHYQAWG